MRCARLGTVRAQCDPRRSSRSGPVGSGSHRVCSKLLDVDPVELRAERILASPRVKASVSTAERCCPAETASLRAASACLLASVTSCSDTRIDTTRDANPWLRSRLTAVCPRQRIRREGIPRQVVLQTAHERRCAIRRQLHLVHRHVAQVDVARRGRPGAPRQRPLQPRQPTHQRRPEVLHALERRPGDERNADRQVPNDRLTRNRPRNRSTTPSAAPVP